MIPTMLTDTDFPDADKSGAPHILELRWQDDRSGKWSKIKRISLGAVGQSELTRSIKPMGIYRSRQFEVTLTDPIPVSLSSIEDVNGVLT